MRYYRIVKRGHENYIVQYRPWWCPFWSIEEIAVFSKEGRMTTSYIWVSEGAAQDALVHFKEARMRRIHKDRNRPSPRVIHEEAVSKTVGEIVMLPKPRHHN